MTKLFKKSSGFSLLEILIAVTILGMSMLVIIDMLGDTKIVSLRSEEITKASMLGRLKLNEIVLELERDMAKGDIPDDDKEMEGEFDEPYEFYKWKAEIKKVEIPIPPDPGGEDGEAAQASMFLTMFKMISEEISKVARSVKVTIIWDELGEEQSTSFTTHIVKM